MTKVLTWTHQLDVQVHKSLRGSHGGHCDGCQREGKWRWEAEQRGEGEARFVWNKKVCKWWMVGMGVFVFFWQLFVNTEQIVK